MAGVATGGLVASFVGFGLSWVLTLIGLDSGPGIGLMIGIITGLTAGGWVAGMRARHSERFHGAVTGLIMAFVIMVIAILGGSQAPTSSVLLLALIATAVSGITGWLAGRRKLARP